MDDSPGSHLSVVIDLSPKQWHLSGESDNAYPLGLDAFLTQLITFLNAHIAAKHENTLAVFGAFPGKSVVLYSSADPAEDTTLEMDANSYSVFRLVDTAIITKIINEMVAIGEDEQDAPIALVAALTKSLCYINRLRLSNAGPPTTNSQNAPPPKAADPRILILSVSPDLTASYIPIMNSIFSAQKLKITVDVCQIYGVDSVFLQQAAHLTGGSYIYLERRDALLQYLVMTFLSSPSVRKILSVPTQDKVDFRAACFCHKNIVDIGFVCSVCLSIFCKPVPVCSTCRTKFPIKTLQRLNAAKPLLPQTETAPSTPISGPTRASTPMTPNQLPHSSSIGRSAVAMPGRNGTR
ncbi:Tfb4-domain-containing protein [Cylindrobasidium torrendii FP15055 ss-10]|uniref:General transcription and DNA repair factor IIH subunit TFB4 n=1 Tax=Cylindrobasidium torrendii FP15055 ss-10 TaxID=1314674 RepID=A0A0D7BW09_9AGAR|nr:Tfb4-domain-containing protein [Cylindrobasidium torrendii FP15055 ss-10]